MILISKKNIYDIFEIEFDDKTGVNGDLLDEYYIKYKTNLFWFTETYSSYDAFSARCCEILDIIKNNDVIYYKY